jgi:hypothetical protein
MMLLMILFTLGLLILLYAIFQDWGYEEA